MKGVIDADRESLVPVHADNSIGPGENVNPLPNAFLALVEEKLLAKWLLRIYWLVFVHKKKTPSFGFPNGGGGDCTNNGAMRRVPET